MRGCIYRTSIDHLKIDPHPHAVLVVAKGQCLVVPAYTPGQYKISEKIEALKAAWAYREDQVCVHIDNAKYFRHCAPGFTGHLSCWFTWETYWTEKKTLEALTPSAQMSPDGMEIIACSVLEVCKARREFLSDEHVAQVSRWIPQTQ